MEIKPPVEIRLGLIKSNSRPDSFFLFARGALEGFEDRLAKMGFHYDPVKDGFRRPFDCYIIDELRTHPLDYEVTEVVSKQYYYEKEKIKPYPFFPSADLKLDLFPFQTVGRDFILDTGSCIVADEMGLGKCLSLDSKILTPIGWKLMGEVEVGDYVIGSDGKEKRVLGVYPQGEKDIYKVTFSDGCSVECCDEHLWAVTTALRKWQKLASKILPLSEIRKSLLTSSGNRRYFIPIIHPVEFHQNEKLPIDPYLLGVLIGDGSLIHQVRFSTIDIEIIDSIRKILPKNHEVVFKSKCDYSIIGSSKTVGSNVILNGIRSLGLLGKRSNSKFIPDIYKFASIPNRKALLQGLLDTDGYVNPEAGNIEYTSVSKQLAEDIQFLVQSLGGIAKISLKPTKCQLAYRVRISLPNAIKPFRLARKANNCKERTKYYPNRAIVSVEYAGKKLAQCIWVDSEDNLYATDHCILTHNTPMALAAAERWGSKCLVVSRASLLRQWETEIEKFTSSSFAIIEGTPKQRKGLWERAIGEPCHYAVVSYDTLNGKDDREGALAYIKDGAMAVYDEITMVKNYTASRTKAISVLRPHVVIGLTGTPYENHVGEYYQIFRLVRPGLLPPYEVFMDLFTIRESRQIRTKSGRKFSLEMIKKEINLELLAKMVAPAMIRRMRKEVLSLPPSEPIVHNIGMSKLQRQIESFLLNGARLHEELRLPFFTFGLENAICPAMLDSQKIPDNIDLLRLIELLDEMKDLEDEELSKAIRTPRLAEVGAILDEAGDSKVVIYSRFTKALDLIDKFILQNRGIEPAYFTGFARESKMFIEGDKRVLLMSGAGAYGLNLQEVCHLMILVDKPFNPAVLDQVKGRIDRIGQSSPMQYHEFDTGSTIERRAFEIIKRKGETSDILLARSVMS